ncbi:MAG: thiamine pyrophosphate-dependent enzyme [Gemmatimonadota bacterium]|nr:thiamine pyrophosphate-dependent enzyme [Gemmatimonadota bacterium]
MTTLCRRRVVSRILEHREDALVVSGLGAPTYDCAAAGDSPLNFYLWGAMGGAAMVGLGVALARPDRRVVVVTGDGELLMGSGALAVIGVEAPENLAILVLDNEAFGETGRQAGLTSKGLDLADMASAVGFRQVRTARSEAELDELAELVQAGKGPVLAVAKVALKDEPVALPTRDGALLADRFRSALGVTP